MVAVYYVYEHQFAVRGWPDQAGPATVSWFDRDLAEPTAGPPFFVNENIFFAPLIQYEVFPQLFVNVSKFFPPRAFMLLEPTHTLKNEVRRILILKRETTNLEEGEGEVYVGRDFPPMEYDESDVFGFDFINDLRQGEKILQSRWEIEVVDGLDTDAQARLQGLPALFISEGNEVPTVTMQRLGFLVPGTTYVVRARIETDFGNIKRLRSHIRGEASR